MSIEIVIEAKPKVTVREIEIARENERDADNAMKLPCNQVVNQVAQRAASA